MELLTAWLQKKQPMEKEVVMEAWHLDEAVEHIHKSIGDLSNSAHLPNHCPAIDSDCLEHPGMHAFQGVHC